MAYAYKSEERGLDSLPEYRYATGTIKVKYIFPTPNKTIKLIARIESYSEKKVLLKCDLISDNAITVQAEVLAFRVYDSNKTDNNEFAS